VCVSQTLRPGTAGATYIRQGGHHVGHWSTFYSVVILHLFNDRLEQRNLLRTYNSDFHQIFRAGRHVGADVRPGFASRSLKGRCHGNQF